MDLIFFVNSLLLGVGLAMDAFSVSLANGLNEPHMRASKIIRIAGCFALFQFLMPMIGWFCVHAAAERFAAFQKFIPWIALILLAYIGGKMLREGIVDNKEHIDEEEKKLEGHDLLIQGIATSIDALSVGFTIADYNTMMAFSASLIIAIVTFAICYAGVLLGRRFGTILAGKASILGGIILIGIGIEIFVQNIF